MKCQILFHERKKKTKKENISKCLLLKILPGVLSVKNKTARYSENWASHFIEIVTEINWKTKEITITVFFSYLFRVASLRPQLHCLVYY